MIEPSNQKKEIENSNQTEDLKLIVANINNANKLINDESNRLITWSLSIIGGSILIIISTDYIRPDGKILYSFFLFALGWFSLGMSIYLGEIITRIYIASVTAPENNHELIRKCGVEIDQKFAQQIKWFQWGIIMFAIWLMVFLFWFILFNKN